MGSGVLAQSISKIGKIFPGCITETKDEEGRLKKVVNFKLLRQILGDKAAESGELYEFTWPGKATAIAEANKPIRKTLRPCPEESVNWDDTENLYIEGDNLDALKLLQENYLDKVKMIYIDPPYDTGSNKFVYNDRFNHSDWCSMIYSRLMLARNLLADDGVIFISIDDNEQGNLRKICDEIFGAGNFVAQLIWERAYAPKNDAKFVSNSHDYVLVFAKDISSFVIGRLPRTEEANARYHNPDNDPRGVWKSSDISVKTYNADCDYPITTPSGRIVEPPAGRCWRQTEKAFLERVKDNRIWFGEDGSNVPCLKRFLSELKFDGMAPTSIMSYKDVGHSQEGAKEVTALMGTSVFDGPKPVRLLLRLITLANLADDSIALDFFSGSATTAHAVMQHNVEKGEHCRFIMVQLPEVCNEKSAAFFKTGYANICEIGKERIRRAAKKIAEEKPLAQFDGGFRVYKVVDA